jgi:hypothetical protein
MRRTLTWTFLWATLCLAACGLLGCADEKPLFEEEQILCNVDDDCEYGRCQCVAPVGGKVVHICCDPDADAWNR